MSALVAIEKLLDKARQDQILNVKDEDEEDEDTTDLKQLQAFHQLLRSKVDASQMRAAKSHGTRDLLNTTTQNYSFSGATDEHLLKMNIIKDPSHSLKLRTAPRPVETDTIGVDSLWSADMLYRHLQFLEGLVPQTASFDLSTQLRF